MYFCKLFLTCAPLIRSCALTRSWRRKASSWRTLSGRAESASAIGADAEEGSMCGGGASGEVGTAEEDLGEDILAVKRNSLSLFDQ